MSRSRHLREARAILRVAGNSWIWRVVHVLQAMLDVAEKNVGGGELRVAVRVEDSFVQERSIFPALAAP
jgi:hypothetical protein